MKLRKVQLEKPNLSCREPNGIARHCRQSWRRSTAVAAAALWLCAAATSAQAAQFGTRCQERFEDSWQSTVSWSYEICSGLNNKLDNTDTKDFYYSLAGSTCGFSTCDGTASAGGVDTVDLFYVVTHGGTDASNALLAMWAENEIAQSSDWRYGDENDEVAIFSQYACEVMENGDGNIWTRWDSVFRGGAYLVTGSHGSVYGSIATDEVGRDYADDLQDGKTVKNAWFDGNSDWYHDQDLAIMATGSTSSDCRDRRNNMTWSNIYGYPRLQDSSINYWCRSRITG